MLITRAHVNDPCFRQIEESVPHSPLMIMSSPDGVVLPNNASSSDIARFQMQLALRCKSTFRVEQVFAHGDVATWRISAQHMAPPPTVEEFNYAFTGWEADAALEAPVGTGLQSIWENHVGLFYDAYSFLTYFTPKLFKTKENCIGRVTCVNRPGVWATS